MNTLELSNVSSQYGAPMGRRETRGDSSAPVAFTLTQLLWEDGAYDTGGAYWGGGKGEYIYHALGDQDDTNVELFRRARSFSGAESLLLKEYPFATFVRAEQQTTEKIYWFTASSGRFQIGMTMAQAESMSHSGLCDADVAAGLELPSLAQQLAAIDPDSLRRELKEYGAWDDADLSDHQQNLSRILWLAAGDIKDNPDEE
jgi:hypothetical protein